MNIRKYYVQVRTDENVPSPTDRFMSVEAPSKAKAKGLAAQVDRVIRVVEVCPASELSEPFDNPWREIVWAD